MFEVGEGAEDVRLESVLPASEASFELLSEVGAALATGAAPTFALSSNCALILVILDAHHCPEEEKGPRPDAVTRFACWCPVLADW